MPENSSAYPDLAYPDMTYPDAVWQVFRPPVIQRPLTVDRPEYRPFSRVKGNVGLTVLKTGASYVTVENPEAELVDAADIAYLGGHEYEVDEIEAAALTAAGYTVVAI